MVSGILLPIYKQKEYITYMNNLNVIIWVVIMGLPTVPRNTYITLPAPPKKSDFSIEPLTSLFCRLIKAFFPPFPKHPKTSRGQRKFLAQRPLLITGQGRGKAMITRRRCLCGPCAISEANGLHPGGPGWSTAELGGACWWLMLPNIRIAMV